MDFLHFARAIEVTYMIALHNNSIPFIVRAAYFLDRKYLFKRDRLIIDGQYLATVDGPISKSILDLINGEDKEERQVIWDHYFEKDGDVLKIKRVPKVATLSKAIGQAILHTINVCPLLANPPEWKKYEKKLPHEITFYDMAKGARVYGNLRWIEENRYHEHFLNEICQTTRRNCILKKDEDEDHDEEMAILFSGDTLRKNQWDTWIAELERKEFL